VIFILLPTLLLADVPSFPLKNAAVPGLTIPAIGIGTGGYGHVPLGYGVYPECSAEDYGCGDYAVQMVTDWLQSGGRRIDASTSYGTDKSVAAAIQKVGIKREQLFITQKVGPTYPLGYNDTLQQFQVMCQNFNTTYFDLILIHWPTMDPNSPPIGQTIDPACQMNTSTFNDVQCRLNTWKALVEIFNAGGAKAIGVSNYQITHLQEIIDASFPLPSVNQCPFHLYRSSTQQQLRDFCKSKDILWHGYSPLGVPDLWTYPGPKMSPAQLKDPVVISLATKYGVTPAQILLNWECALGMPTQARSQNLKHQQENLAAYNFSLTNDEINLLLEAPQDYCSLDPTWYECAPDQLVARRRAWFGHLF